MIKRLNQISQQMRTRVITSVRFLLVLVVLISAVSASVYTYTRPGMSTRLGLKPATAEAATSNNLNYQARLLRANGSLVPDGYYNLEFKLYSAASGGSALWTENYYDANGTSAGQDNRVRVVNGYLSVNLGSQTAFPSNMNWDQDLWLTMNVGGATQTAAPTYDGEMNPRIKLTAVPYAFQAQRAEQLTKSISGFLGQLLFTTGLGQNTTYTLVDPGMANVDICLSSGNCAGSGGGIVGSGTAGRLSYFNTGGTIANSYLLQGPTSLTLDADKDLVVDTNTLYVDAQGNRVGVGTATPGYTLDVQGGTGVVAQFSGRVKGGEAVASDEFVTLSQLNASGGGANYIVNQTTNQANANINITSVGDGDITAVLRARAGQSVDILQVQDSTGTPVFGVSRSGNVVAAGRTTTNGLVNTGSTLNSVGSVISNLPTGGVIGTAAATVDSRTTLSINQTSSGQTLSLPNPTDTTGGRIVYVLNSSTNNTSFVMYGVTVVAGSSQGYIWTGTGWVPTNIDVGGNGASSIGTLDGQSRVANGAVITGGALYLQTANASFAGLISTSAQEFGGAKTFKDVITADGAGTGLAVTNNATVGGTLTVTGPISTTSNAVSAISATGGIVSLNGDIRAGQNNAQRAVLGRNGGNIGVYLGGASSYDVSLVRSGAGALAVTGDTSITGTLTASGATTVNNTLYVNTNSTTAFRVEQSGVNNNTFVVDTANGKVGVGVAPASDGAALQVNSFGISSTGNISSQGNLSGVNLTLNSTAADGGYITKRMVAGGTIAAGDVVVYNNSYNAVTTTNARDPRVVGVAINGGIATNGISVAIAGNALVNVDTSAVAVGDQLVASTTSGRATVDNNATTGIIGYAMTAKAAGSNGQVGVYLQVTNGQPTPRFQAAADSTNAFQIQNAAGTTSLFTADTTNGKIGIGMQPSSTNNARLQVSGGIYASGNMVTDTGVYLQGVGTGQGNVTKQVVAGTGGVAQYDAVILNSDNQVVTSTVVRDPRVYGVVTSAAAASGGSSIVLSGNYKVNADTGAIAVGDQLVLSGTAGRVMTDNNATTGIIGFATTSKAAGSAGTVDYIARTVNGQSTPVFRASANSATAFQIQNASGASEFNVDTVSGTSLFNNNLAVGAAITGSKFSINTSLVAATINQLGANDLLRLQNNGVNVATFTSTGSLLLKNSTDSTTALEVRNAGNNKVFVVDTANQSVGIGADAGTGAKLLVSTGSYVGARINQTGTADIMQLANNGTNVLTVGASGNTTLRNSTNSNGALSVQNSLGENVFNIDTTNSNLVTNSSFETDISGWVAKGGASLTQSTTQSWIGSNSLAISTGASAGFGAAYPLVLSPNTTYTLTAQVRLSAGGGTNVLTLGRQDVSGTDIDCGATYVDTRFYKLSCTFTTGATVTNPNVYFKQTDSIARTINIDAVQVTASTSSVYQNGRIQLNGVVSSPAVFQNASNSISAFQILQAGSNSPILNVNTNDREINVNGRINLVGTIVEGYTNTTSVATGDVVVMTDASGVRVATSTTPRDPRILGVAVYGSAAGAGTAVHRFGITNVNADASYGPINIGDQLVVSATSGRVMADNNATSGILGRARSALASGTGAVSVEINVTGGQATPRFQAAANSVTAFQIQNANGTSNLFNADTVNSRIGIGTNAPAYTLDVVSSDAISARFSGRVIGGNAVNNDEFVTLGQANSLFTPGGSGSYIQNGTTQQTANFNISGTGTVGTLQVNGNASVTTSSATALKVGASSGTAEQQNTLIVDTAAGVVGIGAAPTAGNARLQVAGNIAATSNIGTSGNFVLYGSTGSDNALTKQIVAGTGGVAQFDVVVLAVDSSTARVITSTTLRDTRVYGVATTAQTAGNGVSVAIAGVHRVNADTAAVAIGDQLVVSGTSGRVTVDNNATTGILGYATSTKAAGSTGVVYVSINTVNGQLTPNFRSDSTTAFQIQNAAGNNNLFVADTSNGKIGIGVAPTNTLGLLQVGVSGSFAASNGITFGQESTVNLYRSASGVLRTDAGFYIQGNNQVQGTFFAQGVAAFGSAAPAAGQQVLVTSSAATNIGLVVRGHASQTAELMQVQTGGGAVALGVQSSGLVYGTEFVSVNGNFRTYGSGSGSAGTTALNLQSGTIFGTASGTTGAVNLGSGANSTTGSTGAVSITSGNATAGSSGNITIDSGSAAGSGNTAGTISIGGTNAASINIGRSGIMTNINGNAYVAGTAAVNSVLYVNSGIQLNNSSSSASLNNLNKVVNTTGTITLNDVVIYDDAGLVSQTTTPRDTRIAGVVTYVGAGNTANIALVGVTTVDADAGAVAIGDQLVTSTTASRVTVDNNATTGILGYATTAKAAGAVGTVGVRLEITGGQYSPRFQNATNSATAFQIQAAGTSGNVVFNADTTNTRIGIGTNAPLYTLDVQGGTGIVGRFSGRVIGANAVNNDEFITLGQANTNYAAASGSANYIQNGTTVQAANFNIQGVNTTGTTAIIAANAANTTGNVLEVRKNTGSASLIVSATGLVNANAGLYASNAQNNGAQSLTVAHTSASIPVASITGAASQTADLLQFKNNSGSVLSTITATGALQGANGAGTDAAGGVISINGGQGTGTGAGGSINFGIYGPAVSTGSTNNTTLSNVLSLSGSNGAATFRNIANSNAALQVQNATGSTVFRVDTNFGDTYASGNTYTSNLTLTGTALSGGGINRQAVVGTGGAAQYDVVVINASNQVVKTTTLRDTRVYGVMQQSSNSPFSSGTTANVVVSGNVIVNADASSAAIAIGDQLVTSTTSGAVVKDNNATTGIVGYATSALASGTGTVTVRLNITGGQANPYIRTTDFRVQNTAGTTDLFRVDGGNNRLAVGPGAIPANGILTVGTNTTTSADGIFFGTDTSLYRSDINQLSTGGQFRAGAVIVANNGGSDQVALGKLNTSTNGPGITFGNLQDTGIYRFDVGVLATNNRFLVNSANSGVQALSVRINGNTNDRLAILGDGTIQFGSGSAVLDTTLSRSTAGALQTNGSFTAQGSNGFIAGVAGSVAGKFTMATTGAGSVTLQAAAQTANRNISIPTVTADDSICLQNLGNCGNGTVGGTGTANMVARFTSSTNLGVGVLYDTGTMAGVGVSPTTGTGMGILQVGAANSTTADQGITFGGQASVNLYRSSSNVLKTDGGFAITGNNSIGGTLQVNGTSSFLDTVSISGSNSTMFKVGATSGASNLQNAFIVDTVTGRVGIGQAPTNASAQALQVTGSVAITGTYDSSDNRALQISNSGVGSGQITKLATVNSTTGVSTNDVVVLINEGGNARVATTTTARDNRVYGVVYTSVAAGGPAGVAIEGNATVNIATAAAVSVGDQLVTSTVAGQVMVDNNATTGIVGYATSAKAAGSGTAVTLRLAIVNGQTNPYYRTSDFRIQNAAGSTDIFRADGTRVAIGAGAVPANGMLTIGTDTTSLSGGNGLYFGTDTALYRSGVSTLSVNGQFTATSLVSTGGIFTTHINNLTTGLNTVGAILQSGGISGSGTGNTGSVTIQSGSNTSTGNTGNIIIQSGSATNGTSGAVTIDAGAASGTRGAITIGATNASAITLGRSGLGVTMYGFTSNGANTIDTNHTQALRVVNGSSTSFMVDTANNKTAAGAAVNTSGATFQVTGNQTVLGSNTEAFRVSTASGTGSSVQQNLLVVDTANGVVGIGATPIAGNARLQVNGSIGATSFYASSGSNGFLKGYLAATGGITASDVVVAVNESGNVRAGTSTTVRDQRVIGVAQNTATAGTTVNVFIAGETTVSAVSGAGTAIVIGDQLVASSEAGKVVKDNNATSGIVGYATTNKVDGGTAVGIRLAIVSGQANPNFAGPITVQGSGTSVFTGTVQGADAVLANQFITLGQANSNYAAASGSANYIQNGTSLQSASFNIDGTGTIGTLAVMGNATFNGNVTLGNAASDTITFTGVAGSTLDMNNNIITNIGNANTDFTSTGGLNLAGVLSASAGITTTTTNSTTLNVTSNKTTATAAESYGQNLGTTYSIADTGLKQGLRVTTSANHTSGTIADMIGGLYLNNITGNGGTVGNSSSLWTRSDVSTGATVTAARGLYVQNGIGAGTITDQYGIHITNLTKGTNDYAIRVDGADTQALWLGAGGNYTTAAQGIAFGSGRDVNLYRSGNNTLATDDSFSVLGTSSLLRVEGTGTSVFVGTVQGADATANNQFVTLGQANTNYAAATGSANYIQNGTALQTANFNINGTGTVGTLAVTGNATVGGTLQVTGATTLNGTFQVNNTATVTTNSATALKVGTTAGTTAQQNTLVVNTSSAQVGIGMAPDSGVYGALQVNGGAMITGTAPAYHNGAILSVEGTLDYTGGNVAGVVVKPVVDPASASSVFYSALTFSPVSESNNLTGATMAGLYGGTYYYGTGTVGTSVGGAFQVQNDSTGTLSNAFGTVVYNVYNPNGGTITRSAGMAVENQTRSASNNTNLLLGTLNIPNGNYSIYNSSTYNNYFAGSTTIGNGSTTPSAVLHINSSAASNLFRVTDATATAVDVLNIADGGAATFRNQTNSANAFRIQNADASATLFNVSTTAGSNLVTIGAPLTVTGQTTTNSLSVTNAATVGTTLSVTGNFTVNTNKFTVNATTGDTTIGGVLNFGTNATISAPSAGNLATSASITSTGDFNTITVQDSTGDNFSFMSPYGIGVSIGGGLTSTAFVTGSTGQSDNKFEIYSDGLLAWGSGTSGTDTALFRSAANTLRTDDAFSIGDTLTVTNAATVGGLVNNGSTRFGNSALSNFAANGPIGTAAATVDAFTSFTINQTSGSGSRTLTLPTPTNTAAGRIVLVSNIGTDPFVMHNVTVQPTKAQTYIWTGSYWTATNIDGAGSGATYVGGLDAQPRSVNGAVISGNGLFLQTADATNAGLISADAQTFGGAKTFNAKVTAGLASGVGLEVTSDAVIGGALTVGGNFTVNTDKFTVNGTTGNTVVGGSLTVSTLTAGIVQSNGSGLLSSGAVDRNSATLLSGQLSVSNGGTGRNTFTTNGILYGNASGQIQNTAAANDSILATNGSGVPSLTATLPTVVQGNITTVGTITSGTWNGNALTDTYVSDTLTIGAAGNVAWTALSGYPAACNAGTALTALGDTVTCSGFIQNTTTTQTANIAIQTGNVANPTIKLVAAGSQTADIIQVRNSADNTTVFSVTPSGGITGASLTTTGNITTNGAVNARGVSTTNTSNTFNGQYTLLGRCTINTQYQDCRTVATIVSGGDGGTAAERATVDFRVKQQAALGSNPFVTVQVNDSTSNMNATHFTAVTTTMNATTTVVDLYGQINTTFQHWHINPLINTGSVQTSWLANQGFAAALPTAAVGANAITTTYYGQTFSTLDTTNSAAFRRGADYATTGTSNNVNFGDTSLVRLTGTATQTITGIANGRDGEIFTIINAGNQAAIISNNDAASTASNRITTGTGGNISIPVGASITMVYDSGASLWRVTSAAATTAAPGVNTVGAIASSTDGSGKVANGAAISGTTITLQTADATSVGLVTAGAQEFGGLKTFRGGLITTTLEVGTYNASNQRVSISGGAGNHGIEIGRTDGTASTPFFDFHSFGGTANDYDARIIASGGAASSNGAGTLTLQAATTAVSSALTVNTNKLVVNTNGQNAFNGAATAAGLTVRSNAPTTDAALSVIMPNTSGNAAALKVGNGTVDYLNIDAFGKTVFRAPSGANAADFFQVQNSGGNTALGVNVNNQRVFINMASGDAGAYSLDVGGNGRFSTTLLVGNTLTVQNGVDISGGSSTIVGSAVNINNTGSGTTSIGGSSTGGNVLIQGAASSTITLGNTAQTGTIQLGNSTTNGQTINIGHISSTASTNVNILEGANTGTVNIGRGFTSGSINIGGANMTGDIRIGNSSSATGQNRLYLADSTTATGQVGVVKVATNATGTGRNEVTIGSQNASSFTLLQGGTGVGAVTLQTANSGSINIGANSGSNSGIVIGSSDTAAFQAIDIGYNANASGSTRVRIGNLQGAGNTFIYGGNSVTVDASTINLGGNAAQDINIGTNNAIGTNINIGVTGAGKNINIGNNTSQATNVVLGSLISGSGTTIQGGSGLGAITLATASGGNISIGDTGLDGTIYIGNIFGGVANQVISIGSNYTAGSITDVSIGSNVGSSTTTLRGGSTSGVTVRSANGTKAFNVQDASNQVLFAVDTTNNKLKVGDSTGTTSASLTVFQLDSYNSSNGLPTGAAYLGSMYYDTSTGRIQCYQSNGWGACGAAPDVFVSLTPEYPNMVLNGTGVGTLTSDFCGNGGGLSVNTGLCASGISRNFYKWTSPQASEQVYSMYVSYKLPSTFKSFANANTMNLTWLTDSANGTNGKVTYQVYRSASAGGLTSCDGTTESTVTTPAANTWYTTNFNGDETACSFTGGDTVIFKINVKASNGANVYVENLNFTYTNQ